jgi:beta-glucosidase
MEKTEMTKLLRQCAADGAVLLKNNGVLPFEKGSKLSLFSRINDMWLCRGYGSGGSVRTENESNLTDAVRNCTELELNEELAAVYKAFAKENPPAEDDVHSYEEMPVSPDLAREAAKVSYAAVITIGRRYGEGNEGRAEKGSYYLTDTELDMIKNVTEAFDKVLLIINSGSIIDMAQIEAFGDKIGAILYAWLGGEESGNAVCDLLCGRVSPSGKLVDTIAKSYEDYPSSSNFGGYNFNNYEEDIYVGYRYFETFAADRVYYPFGYGLSYSEFEYTDTVVKRVKGGFEVSVTVKNTGEFPAKESVQVYLEKPCGKLGNPARVLVAFAKTKELKQGGSETLCMSVSDYALTSYDDCGATGYKFAYVTEEGDYAFLIGKNIRDSQKVYTFRQDKTELYSQHIQAAAPQQEFNIICAKQTENGIVKAKKAVTVREYSLKDRILSNLPPSTEMTGDRGIKLQDVKDGRNTLDEFIAQFTAEELDALTRGDFYCKENYRPYGGAGAFGGVTDAVIKKGVPAVVTCDGPAGVTLEINASLLPVATLLACTYDTELVERLYSGVAQELKERKADVYLAPALNIHRNPLCGRNFEYFSEDPLISGRMAAAAVRGSQSLGGCACIKHFACNNQEKNRTKNDSRLSERALREIYLKGFEIAVKESAPKNLMTSYNLINGVWGHYNYDLVTTILRGEWGYKGNVMTDWFIEFSGSPDFENIWNQAYRIRGGIDLFMPGSNYSDRDDPEKSLTESYGSKNGITLGEMQRCASDILKMIIDIKL